MVIAVVGLVAARKGGQRVVGDALFHFEPPVAHGALVLVDRHS
jgi:hypothetical protein